MSSILKALRKIEEEKRAASHAAPDLRSDQGGAAEKSRPLLLLSAGVALGAVFVGLLLLWLSSDVTEIVTQTVSTPRQAEVSGQTRPPVSAVPDERKSLTSIESPSQNLNLNETADNSTLSTLIKAEPVPVKPEPVPVKPEPVPVKPEPVPVKPEPVLVKPEPVLVKPEPVLVKPEPALVKPEPAREIFSDLPEGVSLQISEIFYQDDSASSMALVNDLPVMVGTLIDSAVVLEIRPDNVLFEIDGKVYVISVNPSQ